ncbi:MAG TPA: phosphoribosylglycinamide formyltransferase [Rhodothermales bacterium]|nr:phosphoribosylglycinamide formyltransferase [Rhodothermales bacterium]HRR09463.1 phosphoribosylglycinamide formyltransferase [Rhodothermales bacterium]
MNLAVFASGGGSNFQAIGQAVTEGKLDARLSVVVSNLETAGVHERAALLGVPSHTLNPAIYSNQTDYHAHLLTVLAEYEVDFIALAGYLKKIPQNLIEAFQNRILNIHPSLLPAFGGKGMYGHHVHEAVLAHGVRWTGATVHLVDAQYDTGPIVLQEPVPVRQDDSLESLAARVLYKEHRLYPEALQLFATGKVKIIGRKVEIAHPRPRSYHCATQS